MVPGDGTKRDASRVLTNLRNIGEPPIVRWVLYFFAWTLIGLFWATRWYLLYKNAKDPITWSESIALGLVEWYLWAIFSVLIFRLSALLPFDRSHWRKSGLVHLASGAAVSLLHVLIYTAANRSIDLYFMKGVRSPGLETFSGAYWLLLRNRFHGALLTYVLIAMVSYAIAYYRRFRREELLASELRAQLVGAQLQALKAQLHPHFLFNTLHTISSLIHEDKEAADRMISRLGDLLRLALRSGGKQTIPLREELEFVERYLEVERIRFSDRLRTEIRVSPAALEAEVPNLILQPLVENAIRHGITPKSAGGMVRVSGACEGGMLRLEVSDDGVGLDRAEPDAASGGIGLSNIRERLQHLYGDAAQFSMVNDAGLTVTILIPLRYSTPAPADSQPAI